MKQHLAAALVVLGCACIAAPGLSESQGPGGGVGGQGRMGRRGMDPEQIEQMRARMEAIQAGDVEPLWAALSLKVAISALEEAKLKPLFLEMMAGRDLLLNDVKDENWKNVATTLTAKRKAFDTKLREILSDEQERKLGAWQKARDQWREPFGRRHD